MKKREAAVLLVFAVWGVLEILGRAGVLPGW